MLAVVDPPWKINPKAHLPGDLPGSHKSHLPDSTFQSGFHNSHTSGNDCTALVRVNRSADSHRSLRCVRVAASG